VIDGLHHVAELIRNESGMSLGSNRMPALAQAVARLAPGMDGARVAARAASAEGATLLRALIDEVTVNETFFFRNPRELASVDWFGLAEAARADGRREVRAWSAACASGEEAYTLAIMACERFANSTPPVSVLATDISRKALDRARAGVYRERSVRPVDPRLRERYLSPIGGGFGVKPILRNRVRFASHNLARDPSPPRGEDRFDLIVCRNVLIYFEAEVVVGVMESLESALSPGGALVLGTADRLCDSAARPGASGPRPQARPERRHDESRPAASERPGSNPPPTPSLASAMAAADAGLLDDALHATRAMLASDPLDPDAHFVRGLAARAAGDTEEAVSSLRRALYLDPEFPLAAFELGRAHDALAQLEPARRYYVQALHTLERCDGARPGVAEQVVSADLAAACRARLHALAG
jgi:chemotaxis protein methyltransferase CheR